jgi:galactokinase/mevalonate kinase-like predicted kinase
MKFSSDKDINLYTKHLVRDGWRFKQGKKHGKLLAPGSQGIVVVPSTPSKRRSLQEMVSTVSRIKRRR